MADLKEIILNNSTETLDRILSPFIEEQFPLFVRTDHRKLILFIKAYYEWLEKESNPGYVLANLDSVGDVDENLEQFYSHFKKTYLEGFPDFVGTNENSETPNKKTLIKKIREFYGNKGTESAYEFLFRVLYDSDVDFYYPKEDILKASDGQWIEPRSIKTTSNNGTSLLSSKGGTVSQTNGTTVFSSAFIESVVQYSFNGLPITEFFISNISGAPFTPDTAVTVRTSSGTEYTETAFSVLGEFFVELDGSGYQIGDTVTVVDSNGSGFAAKVDQTGLAGNIKKLAITNSGINYKNDLILNIISNTGQQSAKVLGLRSAVTNYPGYFAGNRGKVSSNKYIQDGHYYQDFSYELKSSVSFDTYFSVLKTIAHPSGMRMFGSILVKKSLQNTPQSSSQGTFYERPVIGKYTPYTLGTTLDLRNNGVTAAGSWLGATGDLYPLGYNPYIGSTTEVGPDGSTTSLGTIFVGTSLGYTYCYVPEGGKTSHNPIGAPLGGITSWYLGNETRFTPQGMSGLVLWLKPENIGVCGSVVNGASMDVWTDASPSANHAVPPTWDRWTTNATYAGVTIDKLRPTLVINDNGVAGATGISFDGGVIFGPQTLIRDSGLTLASAVIGITFAPGSSGDKLLVGRHFYLKNGLTLSADMDLFIVYRPTLDSFTYGLGLISSNKRFTDSHFSVYQDYVVFSRSWNSIDLDPNSQTSVYYNIVDGKKLYPVGTGVIGFRPWIPFESSVATAQKTSIAYDPHVSGQSMGRLIGEVARDSSNVLYAFANGDRAINKSRSTSLFVSNISGSGAESSTPVCGVTIDIGRFGSYHGVDLVSSGDTGSAAWISTAITNAPYGFRGVINEVIVFDRKLNEEERQQVHGYLSRKYKMTAALPNKYSLSHNSAFVAGLTYWYIENHPNTKGLLTVPSGISFSGITLTEFFNLPDTIYKSKGTRLASGVTLAGDTYNSAGL